MKHSQITPNRNGPAKEDSIIHDRKLEILWEKNAVNATKLIRVP
jgi:hypothetical protein